MKQVGKTQNDMKSIFLVTFIWENLNRPAAASSWWLSSSFEISLYYDVSWINCEDQNWNTTWQKILLSDFVEPYSFLFPWNVISILNNYTYQIPKHPSICVPFWGNTLIWLSYYLSLFSSLSDTFQISNFIMGKTVSLLVKLLYGEDESIFHHSSHDEGDAGEEVLVVPRGGPAHLFLVGE